MIWFTFCISKTWSPGPARFAPGVLACVSLMDTSLDDSVGTELQGLRNRKPEGRCGVHVDYQFEARSLLDRQVARLRALEDLIDELRRAAKELHLIGAVADQAAGCGKRRTTDRR